MGKLKLYIDQVYKLDVENKINYIKNIKSSSVTLPSNEYEYPYIIEVTGSEQKKIDSNNPELNAE